MGGKIARKLLRAVSLAFSEPKIAARKIRVLSHTLCLEAVNRVSRRSVLGHGEAVVSLTSFGLRVGQVHLAIESIANGRVRPRRLILWLDEAAVLNDLPPPLQRLQDRGLEVLACPNYGSYKKYYPFATSQASHDLPLVTADDDVIYPRSWLAGLCRATREFPDAVNCYRAHTIQLDNHGLLPYRQWRPRTSSEPSFRAMATGVSGIAYPPKVIDALAAAGEEFLKVAPKADDIWAHVIALRSAVPTRQVTERQAEFLVIKGSQQGTLYAHNVVGAGNDAQIARTYLPSDLAVLIASPE